MRKSHRLIESSHLCGWHLGLIIGIALALTGCTSRSERELSQAKAELSAGNQKAALIRLENLLLIDPDDSVTLNAAREGARVSFFEAKDFQRAIRFNEHLVLYSTDPEEVIRSQKQIVLIYLEHLQDYEKSIIEIGRVLSIETDPKEVVDLRMKLARSFYHLKRFFQALTEINEALKSKEGKAEEFALLLLKANVLTADKKFPEAVTIYQQLMGIDRARAIKENVPMTLAVCLEETKDFTQAMDVLEKIKPEYPVPEYVDLRIKRLKERAKNQPKTKAKAEQAKKSEKK